jgi:hypothetical protein
MSSPSPKWSKNLPLDIGVGVHDEEHKDTNDSTAPLAKLLGVDNDVGDEELQLMMSKERMPTGDYPRGRWRND